MANGTCPPPFLDAALYSSTEGNIYGRLCSDITLPGATPGATCCLPCPVQGYVLQPHILTALHANDIMNAIGIVVGAFVLLSFIFLPEKVTHRSSLGIAITVAGLMVNVTTCRVMLMQTCFIEPLVNVRSIQCANEITPANQSSNPWCGFQGSMHTFGGHSMAFLVVCRTIYLHSQICWNLPFSRIPLIVLNVAGWLIPGILLFVAIGVAGITYTITDHCTIRIDWIVPLLLIPIIIEVGASILLQVATFIYCVNVYLRALHEPPLPSSGTSTSIEGGMATPGAAMSAYSNGSGRYPYRKAMKRIKKVFAMQWRAWVQVLAMAFIGSLFSSAFYFLGTRYVSLQKSLQPGNSVAPEVLVWVVCLVYTPWTLLIKLQHPNDMRSCSSLATFIPNPALMLVAEYSLSTVWVWVSFVFIRLSFFPEWIKLIRRTFHRIFRDKRRSSSSSSQTDFHIHLHTPSKDLAYNSKSSESPYRLQSLQFPKNASLHTPLQQHFKSASEQTVFSDTDRPGSDGPSQGWQRPGSQGGWSDRPGSQRSPSLVKKKQPSKVSVEDILAMRRAEQGSRLEEREYPGIQPLKITQIKGENEVWPTYRFGTGDINRPDMV